MTAGLRIARVNELLKREIADLIERMAETPENVLVTVGGVTATPDLRHARVHISVLGGDTAYRRSLRTFLMRHRADLQRRVARDVVMKYTPVLEFTFDETMEQGAKVLALIDQIEAEADHQPPPTRSTS